MLFNTSVVFDKHKAFVLSVPSWFQGTDEPHIAAIMKRAKIRPCGGWMSCIKWKLVEARCIRSKTDHTISLNKNSHLATPLDRINPYANQKQQVPKTSNKPTCFIEGLRKAK